MDVQRYAGLPARMGLARTGIADANGKPMRTASGSWTSAYRGGFVGATWGTSGRRLDRASVSRRASWPILGRWHLIVTKRASSSISVIATSRRSSPVERLRFGTSKAPSILSIGRTRGPLRSAYSRERRAAGRRLWSNTCGNATRTTRFSSTSATGTWLARSYSSNRLDGQRSRSVRALPKRSRPSLKLSGRISAL